MMVQSLRRDLIHKRTMYQEADRLAMRASALAATIGFEVEALEQEISNLNIREHHANEK